MNSGSCSPARSPLNLATLTLINPDNCCAGVTPVQTIICTTDPCYWMVAHGQIISYLQFIPRGGDGLICFQHVIIPLIIIPQYWHINTTNTITPTTFIWIYVLQITQTSQLVKFNFLDPKSLPCSQQCWSINDKISQFNIYYVYKFHGYISLKRNSI